ncbi:Gldg family protein [Stieleria varia]|uniref:ABC-type uncharacterized transport system n=1 Tax=Stieleria varia TaxID=2528005 RepID=A0A5C6A356_9BACT|nr:Gldg family protein [Stieleria varia]TWT93836.1 ABC-type uncharacterized transport system [Stieleria varia]
MIPVLSALLTLLLYDVIFVCVLLAIFGLVAGTKRAAFAVMKRNFVGYFSNPTGYVFLCIFVFLTSTAAFWPHDFFNQNLATLDQLNYWYPWIMLVFIPAITMSIWAEERRQGTDELLLTLPADDFDIVIGKYMAAAAIFTASLLFSQLSTSVTLAILTEGGLDTGLIFSTYLGYWFVGATMIAIGMVASFLTGNLTVGFILGALFNAPLAFASLAETVLGRSELMGLKWGELIKNSGIARPFDDFGRGVISSSSVIYFIFVTAVALYFCMVLIGRRHWTGGKDGNTMAYHYLARIVALIVITISAVVMFRSKDVARRDMTDGQVSSLAPATLKLIRELDSDRPIKIDAYISNEIPEMYARTRYELINLLKEFKSTAAANGRTIEVNLYDNIDLFSEEAALAEERFGIEPVTRMVREQGTVQQKRLIMGAAFRAGLQKVVVPIFEYGIPVEYELVRSINTVASGSRKRIGVVKTDANMNGGVSMQGMSMARIDRHPLMDEWSKQYTVDEVDLESPISVGQYDALIAVQPSSLQPAQFQRLLDAMKAGVPTAVFEDPFPLGRQDITPTSEPKQAGGGMFGMGGQPQPKGNIVEMWDLLQLRSDGQPQPESFASDLVWQIFNPYPNLDQNTDPLWLFIDENSPGGSRLTTPEAGGPESVIASLNPDSEITNGLRQVLTLYAGSIYPVDKPTLKHTPLLRTRGDTGTIEFSKINQLLRTGRQNEIARNIKTLKPSCTVAMTIEDETKSADKPAEADGETSSDAPALKVAYVADTDLMLEVFLQIRADPNSAPDLRFQFQNVTFVLNLIDWLTQETDFIEVRKHEPIFASLRMIDLVKEDANKGVREQTEQFQKTYDEKVREADEAREKALQSLKEELKDMQEKSRDGKIPQRVLEAKQIEFQTISERLQTKQDISNVKAKREQEKNIADIRREADQKVTSIQNKVKGYAVALPCIPPLIVGVVVFAARRLRERENISKSRLK